VSSSSSSSATATPLLVAPPHRWNTTATDASSLLGTIGTLIAAGRLTPAPLPGTPAGAQSAGATAAQPPPGQYGEPANATLVYPLRAGAREVPGTITAELRTDRDAANDLRSAAEAEPGVGATPAQVFDPVTEGLLRAGSAVWRGNPQLADLSTAVITARVALLRSLVRVLEPPSPYALGDREAPLPITLANGLPVAMRVRVALSDTPGLRTGTIGEQRIPPMGRLQLRVNAQLTRSGQFSVEARLTTLAGSPLGVPSRLLLRSTAYGTITLWLTGTAGLLLVILAVRRIARRLRGAASTRQTETSPTPSGIPDRSRPPVGAVAASRAPPDGRPIPPGSRAIGPTNQPANQPANQPVRPGTRAGQARMGQTSSSGQTAPRVGRTGGTSTTGGAGTRFPPAGDTPGRTSPPTGYPLPPPPLPPTAPPNQPRTSQPGGRTVGRAVRPPGQPAPSGPPATPARTSAPAGRPGQPGPPFRPMPNGTPPAGRTKPPTGQPGSQGNQAGTRLPADQAEPTAQSNPTRTSNATGTNNPTGTDNPTGTSKPASSVGPIRPGNSSGPTTNSTGPWSPVDRPATPPTRPTRPTPADAPATTPTNPRVPRP
jgi:hypothetical protein